MSQTTKGRLAVLWKLPDDASDALMTAVTVAVKTEIPQAILDAWDGVQVPAGDVQALGDFLAGQVATLNEARQQQNEDAAEFSLPATTPFECQYTYVDNVRVCYYHYGVRLGGAPWTVQDKDSGQEARLDLQISWEGKLG